MWVPRQGVEVSGSTDAGPAGQAVPCIVHVVTSLECGGLERLVVDWTNGRNARWPRSTCIVCLDSLGQLASLVSPDVRGQMPGAGGDACAVVRCLHADRSRFPWDLQAVRKLRKSMVSAPVRRAPLSALRSRASVILPAHRLAAWQYAVLAAWNTGIRVVYTQHGANVHNRGAINRLRAGLLDLLNGWRLAARHIWANSSQRRGGAS